MATCRICNHTNRSGAAYCEKCGASLGQHSESAAAAEDRSSPGDPETGGAQVEGLETEVLAILESGRKIQAIKLYRERTGVGLKEAKEAVEALAQEHGMAASSGGCAGAVLMVSLLCAAAAVLLAYGVR